MKKRSRTWLVVTGIVVVLAVLVVLAIIFWPWVAPWLPSRGLVDAWIHYLFVDLDIGSWGPVATLLLVAFIELVWAVSLGRKAGSHERQWDRLERVHARELEVLNQEIEVLKEERRALRAELELREDLLREEKARVWARFDDLQHETGLLRAGGAGYSEMGGPILESPIVFSGAGDLDSHARGEWRQIISQLERLEVIRSVTTQRSQSAVEAQQHADELLRLGAACYYLGQYERALNHYGKAVDLAPNMPEALVNRAVVNQALSRHQPALQDLDRALKAGENPWAYLYRGLLRAQHGDRKQALEDYSRALRLDGDFVEAYYRRGLLYAELEEHDRAFQDQSRVLRLREDYAPALVARGVARAALGDTQWALADLDQGCALAPKSPEAFFRRGEVRAQVGMDGEALEDFARVVELTPGFAPVYRARGEMYVALEDYPAAISDYDRAVELEPKHAEAYLRRGQARLGAREYQRAIEDFDLALELDPALAVALAGRGAACEKVGEYEQAIRDLDRAVALDPELAIAYYNRGLAYGSMGEYDKASRDLNKAAELDASLADQEQGRLRAQP